MSLNGSVSRSLTLLRVSWERSLSEEEAKLTPGWTVTVELPFIDLQVESYGWSTSLIDRFSRKPYLTKRFVSAFGYEASCNPNHNDYSTEYRGDAELLDSDYEIWSTIHDGYYTE